jgi:ABC-type transport system involved in multi-copper enzyme maturation permease subunit
MIDVEPVDEAAAPPMLPSALLTTWRIARRAAVESLHDRATYTMSLIFAVVLPLGVVIGVLRPESLAVDTAAKAASLGTAMGVYVLIVGLGPSSGAMNIAAGVFAGEKEKGNLAPLLATPASNLSIFAGKVLGSVLPAWLYILLAEVIYLAALGAILGPDRLRLLSVSLWFSMAALVPPITVLGAAVASFISSRVRTYNAAQMATGLALTPVMGLLIGVGFALRDQGSGLRLACVAGLVALDLVILRLAAGTWRREEVMAHQ